MSLAETVSPPAAPAAASLPQLQALLDRQRAAFLRDGPPSAEIRIERLDRCIGLLADNTGRLANAVAKDYGHRSHDETNFADTLVAIASLKHAKAHVRDWMKPEKRKPEFPLGLLGATARVVYQPIGAVGVISPWNYPVMLTFGPLAGILAAGNRCMIKPSEYTPATSALLGELIGSVFSPEEIAVVQGGPDVGEAFSRLAFDHILFTGSTSIGRHVMRAAADNLTPVTLELGGKSPVIVGDSANLEHAAVKIMTGKLLNAGQTCLAPDYAFIPKAKVEAFVVAAQKTVAKHYPTLKDNPDYTSIINQKHYERLRAYLEDARAKGAHIVEINPANEDLSQQEHRKIAPALILDAADDMRVMKEEIFGPLLPIKSYSSADEAIAFINARPRPLGLYYFGTDSGERERVLLRTLSGGVTINDVIFHVAQEELPFGGVGASGIGAYHGHEGFKRFSHARAVFTQAGTDIGALFRPPYGARFRNLVAGRMKR